MELMAARHQINVLIEDVNWHQEDISALHQALSEQRGRNCALRQTLEQQNALRNEVLGNPGTLPTGEEARAALLMNAAAIRQHARFYSRVQAQLHCALLL